MAKVKKAVDAAVDASRSVKSALNDILDMSTEARKARAAEQGFDVDNPVYRGSFSDEVEARPYVHTSEDITTANSYAGDLSHLGIKDLPLLNVEGANVSKYYTSPGRVATREDIKRIAPDAATAQAAFPALKEAGFNSFNDGYQVVVFDPKNIRSVNAAFDPAKRESANLLAGLGGAAVLGGMAAQSPEVEAANIEPDPMTLAVTAAITGAATEFYRRRESKKGFWQQRREELSEIINAGDEFIRPAMPYINSALEALDKPMQGYYGVASALGALAEGNGLDASLQRGATVARQPIEETAQEYGGVLADEGYPLAGTALNTAMQVTGPF